MKKVLLWSIALTAFCLPMAAQTVITGTVTDTKGMPMPGAKVQIKGTDEKVLTNMDGTFSIMSGQKKPKLKVNYVGWKTTTVNGENGITIRLDNGSTRGYEWFAGANVVFPEFKLNSIAPGIMVGRVKDYGWYLKGQFNGTVSSTDGNGWFTGKEKRRYWSASAGAVLKAYKFIYGYVGAGYEARNIYWEHHDGTYHKSDDSYNGGMIDLGVMLRWKMFYVQGGTQVSIGNNFYPKGNFGLGVYF